MTFLAVLDETGTGMQDLLPSYRDLATTEHVAGLPTNWPPGSCKEALTPVAWPADIGDMRILATTDDELDFWLRHVSVGVWLTYGTAGVAWAYFALTWDRPNRLLMSALVAMTAIVSTLVRRLPMRSILRHPRGVWLFYGWSVAIVGFVTALSALDGGPSSPIIVIYCLALIYAAMAYPPSGMVWLGGTIAVVVAGMAAATAQLDAGFILFTAGALALVATMCTLTARNHWRQHERQAALVGRLDQMVYTDSLTGCLNHRAFHERLRSAVDDALRTERPLSLAIADIDEFRFINDARGHPHGDIVLQRVGESLRAVARESDVIARIGGEEFAILLPDTTLEQAGRIAERLRAHVGNLQLVHPVTISIGVSSLPAPAGSVAALLEQADAGVYAAKRSGRDRVVVHGTSGLATPASPDDGVRARVERVITDRLIRARYQPIVSMADGQILGYEALARIDGSNLAPDRWLAMAERAGLRGDMEAAMWDAAIAGGWDIDGLLFLNASPLALLTGALWRCRNRLPSGVVIEVSEQHAITDYQALARTLSEWADAVGTQVAVDDMGSGHANLRHVLNLAPRFLKLDRSLIEGLDVHSARLALVGSMVAFAESTGALLIAEGIETPAEAEAVRAAGVAYGQGYLFARPEPSPPPVHWRPAGFLVTG